MLHIVPMVTIEFVRQTTIRGPEGIVAQHEAGTRIEAYRESGPSWRVPQGFHPDYYVYPPEAKEVHRNSRGRE